MSRWCALPVFFICAAFQVQATVSLTGTRLVLSGSYPEVAIEARNGGNQEVLLQAWLGEPGDDNDAATAQPSRDLPFVVTPALVRLPGQGRQVLRVLHQGIGMPVDRESLLHLYVLEVPQRSAARQQLSIAVRQRINVFYRPPGLPGDPAQAAALLRWSVQRDPHGNRLQVDNPSAFHVALLDLQLDGQVVGDYLLLAPGGHSAWPVPASPSGRLLFKTLTDYGGQRGYCAQTTGQAVFTARLLDTPRIVEDC